MSHQPCPSGQSGDAKWLCGLNGDWVGLPDLTECRVLDTDSVIKELKNENSVPSEVIKNFYKVNENVDFQLVPSIMLHQEPIS